VGCVYDHGFDDAHTGAPNADARARKIGESRPRFEFGNILFGGRCNQKCPFCIGRQIDESLTRDNLREYPLRGFDAFVQRMQDTDTRKVILTGTRTDPQLYRHEARLLEELRERLPGRHIALHTNGMLATRKMAVFNAYDSVTVSFNSFVPETFARLHGVTSMPDLGAIVEAARVPLKLSCVVTEDNLEEVASGRYVDAVHRLGIKRLAVRHLFRHVVPAGADKLFAGAQPVRVFHGNPVYDLDGVEVTHWVFERMEAPSLNLFSDGTLSENYLLADAPVRTAGQ
jgi:MoaA/NifB/PqqE/SkfB family radical SAM enzyme